MRISPEELSYSVVAVRNTQRSMTGVLDERRADKELHHMDRVLEMEQENLAKLGLLTDRLAEVSVNPNLTVFLDGSDGMGGYADVYATSEWHEPGTQIEMQQEAARMREHFGSVLTPEYIQSLREDGRPLVVVEGGAGPDLRTFTALTDVLRSKADELQGVPVQMVHVDISRRMAAITIAKARTSGIPEEMEHLGIDAEIAICHADVFDLLEKVPDDSLSYALLPFGVLSFGLDGKDPEQIFRNVRNKLRPGGGTLATVYNTEWRGYTDLLKENINDANRRNPDSDSHVSMKDLSPFVVDIQDGKMQVGGGLAFNCHTFTDEELAGLANTGGLQVDSSEVTPRGYAYWTPEMLNRILKGPYPNGIPKMPDTLLMHLARGVVLDHLENAGAGPSLIERLGDAIPDQKRGILSAPAPYVTITARKSLEIVD